MNRAHSVAESVHVVDEAQNCIKSLSRLASEKVQYNLAFDLRSLYLNSIMSKKDDEHVDKSRLLEDVQEFCISQSFEAQFEAFAKEHANVFLKALDFTDESTEHPLEFHDVYRKYLTKFEGLIEDFIVKVRLSVQLCYL